MFYGAGGQGHHRNKTDIVKEQQDTACSIAGFLLLQEQEPKISKLSSLKIWNCVEIKPELCNQRILRELQTMEINRNKTQNRNVHKYCSKEEETL